MNVFTFRLEDDSTINNIQGPECQVLIVVKCFCNGIMSAHQ